MVPDGDPDRTPGALEEEVLHLRREVKRLSLFHEVGKELASTLDLSRVLTTIMEKLSELLRPESWSLLLLDEDRRSLHFEIAIGPGSTGLKDSRVALGQGLAGWCARTGEAVVVADAATDPRFDASFDAMTGLSTRTVVCVPIVGREGCLGVVELVNVPVGPDFEEEDLPTLRHLADYAAIAIDNARYVARIHELTITDETTALYNARHLGFVLDAEIYRASRYGYDLSLVFVDLDRFKEVNDRWGHEAGSRLLQRIAELVKRHLRLIDTAFRYGGDEFVLLLPQTGKADAVTVVRRLRELLRTTAFLSDQGIDHVVTASFGIASFPEDGRTRVELLERADEAMYRVKHESRDGIVLAGVPPVVVA